MAKSFAQMVGAIGLYGLTGDRKKLVTQEGDLRGWNDFKKGVPFIDPVTDFIDKMLNQDLWNIWDDDDQ